MVLGFGHKYRRLIILLSILLLALLLLTLQVGGVRKLTGYIERSLLSVLSPFQRLSHWGGGKFSGADRYFENIKKLEAENNRLKEENRLLKEKLLEAEEDRLENQRLSRLLAFKQESPRQYLAAQIIGRDPTNWFKSFTIDKGSSHGLHRHQPVLTHEGLVGRIVETTPHTAKVLTVIDGASNVGALVQKSRSVGVVAGDVGGRLVMKYIQSDEDVKAEDAVVTSGMGGIFPKGLLIGRVKWVNKKPNHLFQEIEITPAVDFSHLEEVLILTTPYYAAD